MRYSCEICEAIIRRSKKEVYACSVCKKIICGKHAYQYTDESNIAITKNSPILCLEDYNKTYEKRINTLGTNRYRF